MKDQISGIFLFTAIILGNFLDTTVGNKLSKYLNNNIFAKFFILFVIIFYTVNFASKDIAHPSEHFYHSIVIFLLYIMITRNYLFISISAFILILGNFTINSYLAYHEEHNNKIEIERYTKYSYYMTRIIIVIIIGGFVINVLNHKANLKGFLKG